MTIFSAKQYNEIFERWSKVPRAPWSITYDRDDRLHITSPDGYFGLSEFELISHARSDILAMLEALRTYKIVVTTFELYEKLLKQWLTAELFMGEPIGPEAMAQMVSLRQQTKTALAGQTSENES